MKLASQNDIVPGLPELLHPSFWKAITLEAVSQLPAIDDERGVVWSTSGYFGDYYDKVQLLTHEQLVAGLKGEILRNLRECDNRQSRITYLDSLSTYLGVDTLRVKAEERSGILKEFGDHDSELDRVLAHADLLNSVQAMIHSAYSWSTFESMSEVPAPSPSPQNSSDPMSKWFSEEHHYLIANFKDYCRTRDPKSIVAMVVALVRKKIVRHWSGNQAGLLKALADSVQFKVTRQRLGGLLTEIDEPVNSKDREKFDAANAQLSKWIKS